MFFFSFKDNLKMNPPVPDNGSFLIFGFSVLQKCLTDHVHVPEIYLLMAGLFLATPQSEPSEAAKVWKKALKKHEALVIWLFVTFPVRVFSDKITLLGFCDS